MSVLLAVLMLIGVFAVMPLSVSAAEGEKPAAPSFAAAEGLYVHAVSGSSDTEAWQMWQTVRGENLTEEEQASMYFFLPSSADAEKVDIYNGFSQEITVDGRALPSHAVTVFTYKPDTAYELTADGKSYTLRFMRSTAEAAIYVNNMNADGKGTELIEYLSQKKSNKAKATGAIVTPDGKIDNTPVNKIKGRGNTTWAKDKKPFNITYSSAVSIAGMNKGKKYSLLANFQDDSLSRNRFLYDLSDAVGMPYASDSRYVDFYSDGCYLGSYQLCEKIEVGKDCLISDFSENDYLNSDGTIKEDFPFLCELDPSAVEGEDYFIDLDLGLRLSIKAPELEEGDVGYEEVKKYVEKKFNDFISKFDASEKVSEVGDVDSMAKLYLINELGKNWDAGVSSFYFTYKQDENGKYKFYGSPVWDYDNSLGNANGITEMLKYFNLTDYTQPTGIWGEFALEPFADHPEIMKRIKEIWFEKFVPAIEHFSGKKVNAEIGKELLTADEYYKLVKGSADMNYKSGWKLYTGEWIADHTKLLNADFDTEKNTYLVNKYRDNYKNDFDGMFSYCRDWMISRAAWLSMRYGKDVKTETVENRPENIDVAEVVPAKTKTKTLRFYMPEDWRSENNPFYDGEDPASCRAGVYWWEGTMNCSDFYKDNSGWAGYSISETDKADGNIFVAKVPDDVEQLVFNNLLKSDDPSRALTKNIIANYYEVGDSEFYPEGLSSVDNMIFVPVKYSTSVLQNTEDGEWFYYYGDGKYGVYKTLAEAQANDAVYSGGEFPEHIKRPIDGFTVSGLKSKTYNGKAQTQNITVKDGDSALVEDIDYTTEYKNNKNAGTATLTITGTGSYKGTITKTFKIAKAKNPMTVKVNAVTVKAKNLKKKNVTVKKAITVKKNEGKVSYKAVAKGTSKGVSISKKGVITVKKGTYKKNLAVTVSVTAKGSGNFKKATKKLTVKIKVK